MVNELGRLGEERPVAIVTGGARRVGAEICRTLARSGCDVLVTYNHSVDEAQALREELQALGVAAGCVQLRLESESGIEAFVDFVKQFLPRLDALVHNASRYVPTPLASLTAEELLLHMQINAMAPALLSASLAPMLAQSSMPAGGAIVALCDIHAMGRPRKDFLGYSMSKAALAEMVQTLAKNLAPQVRVNGVAPGVVAFPEAGYESDPEMQERYLSRVPLGRSGTPGDAAEVARWLIFDAGYITGEIIRLDGGRWLA